MNNQIIHKDIKNGEDVRNFLTSLLGGTDSETIQSIAQAIKSVSVKIELTPNPPMEKMR